MDTHDLIFFRGNRKAALDEIDRLRAELAAVKRARRNDIDLSISYLAQIYGLLEGGSVDEAADFCRSAAETWTQDISELDAALAAKGE